VAERDHEADGEGDFERVPARLTEELERYARLASEQTIAIAHYKKMYDRASTLARIGVWECDLATGTLTWTDGVYDLFGLPRGSAVNRPDILAMYDEESRHRMEQLRAEAVRDGTSFALDIRIRTARGDMRWLRLAADVEKDASGRPVRIFGTKQDITDEKAAQEKLQSLRAELIHLSRRSAMSAMATTLAHELNQPLAAIGNYVAGIRRGLARPDLSREQLERGLAAIEKCAFGAGDIIRSLRQMTSGNPSERRVIDPNTLIREAAALAMVGAGDRTRLRYDLADGLRLCADPIQIQQLLINLVRNALEAAEGVEAPDIVIATALIGKEVRLRIDDNGPGIAPELTKTLFDPFVSSKPGGMGIGLSVSRTIVEAHGGRLTAENRPGGGATFRIALPVADESGEDMPTAA
jgi:PAS domain S-box-containing protein